MESDNIVPARRDVVRAAARLPFVVPLTVTFTVAEARAAGSNHSCYPLGHECNYGGVDPEPCCPGLTCTTTGVGAPRCE